MLHSIDLIRVDSTIPTYSFDPLAATPGITPPRARVPLAVNAGGSGRLFGRGSVQFKVSCQLPACVVQFQSKKPPVKCGKCMQSIDLTRQR